MFMYAIRLMKSGGIFDFMPIDCFCAMLFLRGGLFIFLVDLGHTQKTLDLDLTPSDKLGFREANIRLAKVCKASDACDPNGRKA